MLEQSHHVALQTAIHLLPSFLVDTNESLRQRALRLVAHGVSQKVLAAKMEMAPSTFSKWLNQKDGIGPASVTALDGFNAYVHELAAALADQEDALREEGARSAKRAR
jgi:transcriptional regulator with XRE-family HTH domain